VAPSANHPAVYFANQFVIAGFSPFSGGAPYAAQSGGNRPRHPDGLACFAALLISLCNGAYAFYGFALNVFRPSHQRKVLRL
jgi:hypothetical protein